MTYLQVEMITFIMIRTIRSKKTQRRGKPHSSLAGSCGAEQEKNLAMDYNHSSYLASKSCTAKFRGGSLQRVL